MNKYRHFVPASQEWYNSIYTYNKNYPKTIPVADILLMKLFKCYFNYGIRLKFKPVFSHLQSYLKEGLLLASPQQKKGSNCNWQAGKGLPRLLLSKSGGGMLYGKPATNKSFLGAFSSAKEIATASQEEPSFLRNSLSNASLAREKGSGQAQLSNLYRTALASSSYSKKALKEGASPLPMRYRLLSSKKAFLGKGDLKHTNNKVIITFYLYNANQMFISSNFNDRVKALLLPNKSLKIRQGSEESKAVLATASARQQQPEASPGQADASARGQPMPALAVPLRGHEAGLALPALGQAALALPLAGKRQRVLQGQALPAQALPAQALPAMLTQPLVKSAASKEGASKGAQLAKIILYNRMLNIYEFNASDEHYFSYYNTMASIIKKINIVLANLNYLLAIYIYILKTKIFNNYAATQSCLTKIYQKINSFFFIYNNLFKIKDNLNNNLFNFFKNRLLLNKLPFLITNDILKICSASTFLEGKKAVKPNQWGLMGNRAQAQAQEARQAQQARHATQARLELGQVEEAMSPRAQHQQESSIFNFEYYLYKMSLSYLEKVFLY